MVDNQTLMGTDSPTSLEAPVGQLLQIRNYVNFVWPVPFTVDRIASHLFNINFIFNMYRQNRAKVTYVAHKCGSYDVKRTSNIFVIAK